MNCDGWRTTAWVTGGQELTEKLEKMRFRLQLTSIDDQRSLIPRRQDKLRGLLQRARHAQREMYRLDRSRDYGDVEEDVAWLAKVEELQQSLDDTKEQVNVMGTVIIVVIISTIIFRTFFGEDANA